MVGLLNHRVHYLADWSWSGLGWWGGRWATCLGQSHVEGEVGVCLAGCWWGGQGGLKLAAAVCWTFCHVCVMGRWGGGGDEASETRGMQLYGPQLLFTSFSPHVSLIAPVSQAASRLVSARMDAWEGFCLWLLSACPKQLEKNPKQLKTK